MTAALEGGEWSAERPCRTLLPGKTRYPFYRGRSGQAENLVPTGIRSRIVQPVVSRYTDRATGPTNWNNIDYWLWKQTVWLPRTPPRISKLSWVGHSIPLSPGQTPHDEARRASSLTHLGRTDNHKLLRSSMNVDLWTELKQHSIWIQNPP